VVLPSECSEAWCQGAGALVAAHLAFRGIEVVDFDQLAGGERVRTVIDIERSTRDRGSPDQSRQRTVSVVGPRLSDADMWTQREALGRLGIEAIVPADISEFRVEPNDIYLLCSDGLTDMVDTEVVHGVVDEQRDTLEAAATHLVDLANQNGGRDNISVILARVPAAFLPNNQWAEKYLARRRASP
jgi:protein phosphatase